MHIIGIDAGGTKTFGSVVSKQKELLVENIAGHGNVSVDYHVAINNIKRAIHSCLHTEYKSQCVGIVAGIAGVGQGDLKKTVKEDLEKQFMLPVHVLTDVELAYYALHGNSDGILTVAGTGSIIIAKNRNEFYSVGGWGHLLGDEGSSYHIGMLALKEIAKEFDQGGLSSSFTSKVALICGVKSSNDLKRFVYSNKKDKIASLSEDVAKLASKNDRFAYSLFEQAAESLAVQTMTLVKQVGFKSSISVVCMGSLLVKNQLIQSLYKEKLIKLGLDVSFRVSEEQVVVGAWPAWENAEERLI